MRQIHLASNLGFNAIGSAPVCAGSATDGICRAIELRVYSFALEVSAWILPVTNHGEVLQIKEP